MRIDLTVYLLFIFLKFRAKPDSPAANPSRTAVDVAGTSKCDQSLQSVSPQPVEQKRILLF
jgi:hypothetical protein